MANRNANEKKIESKRKRSLNIGIVVCALILVYLLVYLFSFIFTGNISIFEVAKGTTASRFDSQYTALILRKEHPVNAAGSGYVNFFAGDGSQVYVGEDIYVIDQTGELSSRFDSFISSQAIINENDLSKLRESVYSFDTSFNYDDYFNAGLFKYKLESQVLDIINNNAFTSVKNEISNTGGCVFGKADTAGILIHTVDGFENLLPENIDSSCFKKSNYAKKVSGQNGFVEEGSPVCKIITETNWNLVIQISNPDAFADTDYVTIEFLKDNIETECAVSLFTKAGNTYGLLSLSKYMARYASDRYVQIKIKDDISEGLMIPKSAVFERQFYQIPREYLVQGGNSNEYGFNKAVENGGRQTAWFVVPQITTSNEDYIYISTLQDDVKKGDVLKKNDSADTFTVERKENFNGVFSIESGYTTFRIVNILGENNSYYIVDETANNTIRLYDQIVKDYTKVKEGQEIKE